jgi:hypothetical protein
MKNFIFIFSILFFSYNLFSQESIKQKEIGITFYNLNSFGLTYKSGTNTSLWRFNTIFATGNNQKYTSDSVTTKQNSFGVGLRAGKEFRKLITPKFELRYGADLSFSVNQSKSKNVSLTSYKYETSQNITTYNPGLNLVFGFNYLLGDQLALGIELMPGISYSTGKYTQTAKTPSHFKTDKQDISNFSYGLNNQFAMLSLSYKF